MPAQETITLARYLFERFTQVGISRVFGVPGDYNMGILDSIYPTEGLEWVGALNELNAAYAADGFARETRKPAALFTTYAVGELSAVNGFSGSYSENVPVIHTIGSPARYFQENHTHVHHGPPTEGLTPPDLTLSMKSTLMYGNAHEYLFDLEKAPAQIDTVIRKVLITRQPGTIHFPLDMSELPVPRALLDVPIEAEWPINPETDSVAEQLLAAISKAKSIAVVTDLFSQRWALGPKIQQLVEATGAWSYSTYCGKGEFDESHPQYIGVYNGDLSLEGIQKAVESSELVVYVGPNRSDNNTGGFTVRVPEANVIDLHPRYAKVAGKPYDGVHFVHVLDKVLAKLGSQKKEPLTPRPVVKECSLELTGNLTQSILGTLVSHALKEGDHVVLETGTSQYLTPNIRLPKGAHFYTQFFYGSIGFALPAAYGTAMAYRAANANNRVFLMEGDGSAMMTIQEIASIVRHKLNITIILVNNDGYSIERAIWGPKQGYNDVPANWRWTELFKVFGAQEGETATFQVHTAEEFAKTLNDPAFKACTKPKLVEVFLKKEDYPVSLSGQVAIQADRADVLAENFSSAHDHLA